MKKNLNIGLVSLTVATLCCAPLLNAAGDSLSLHELNNRIETHVFDEPLRESCFKLLSAASEKNPNFRMIEKETRNVFLHARRYRNLYGEKNWQAVGELVAEVFSRINLDHSPEQTKNTIDRYRRSLLVAATELGR